MPQEWFVGQGCSYEGCQRGRWCCLNRQGGMAPQRHFTARRRPHRLNMRLTKRGVSVYFHEFANDSIYKRPDILIYYRYIIIVLSNHAPQRSLYIPACLRLKILNKIENRQRPVMVSKSTSANDLHSPVLRESACTRRISFYRILALAHRPMNLVVSFAALGGGGKTRVPRKSNLRPTSEKPRKKRKEKKKGPLQSCTVTLTACRSTSEPGTTITKGVSCADHAWPRQCLCRPPPSKTKFCPG